MSDGKPKNDPSMDDILASIRKIISDDEARAATNPEAANVPPLRPLPPRPNAGATPGKPGDPPAEPPASDDVLLLTDLVEEPPPFSGPRVDPAAAVNEPRPTSSTSPGIKPIPSPIKSKLMDLNEPQPVAASPAPMRPAAPPLQPPVAPLPPVAPIPPSSTVRPAAAAAAAEPTMRAPADAGPMVSSGGKSVEDLVREMLRPMLQEWIDKNAQGLVEKHIQQEIERLARR